MKTAIEWLVSELVKNKFIQEEGAFTQPLIIKAKEMEKEQHKETFKQSRQAKIFEKDMPPVWESWEQYYNETFKSE